MRTYAVGVVVFLLASACGGSGGGTAGTGGTLPAGDVNCSDQKVSQRLICHSPSVCCAVANGANTCQASSTTCTPALTFACDSADDCAGGVCCANSPAGTSNTGCVMDGSCSQPTCTTSSDCPSAAACCLTAIINGVSLSFCVENTKGFACL